MRYDNSDLGLTEYWGTSSTEWLGTNGAITLEVRRNEPFIAGPGTDGAYEIWEVGGAQVATASSIVEGTPLQLHLTIRNATSSSRTVDVQVEGWNTSTGATARVGTLSAIHVASNTVSSVKVVPLSGIDTLGTGNIKLSPRLKVGGSFTDTWTWWDDPNFTIIPPQGRVDVQIRDWQNGDISSSYLSPGNASVRLYGGSIDRTLTAGSDWTASFTELPDGSYSAEAIYDTPVLGEDEYWGAAGPVSVSGSTESLTVLRNEPFIDGGYAVQTSSGTGIPTGGTVVEGTDVEVVLTVRNATGLGRQVDAIVYGQDASGRATVLLGQTSNVSLGVGTTSVTVPLSSLDQLGTGGVALSPRVHTDTIGAYTDSWLFADPASFNVEAAHLTLRTPNGGESWTAGSPQQIQWSSNLDGNVEVWLIRNEQNAFDIEGSTANDGSYTWSIPSSLADRDDYKIGIRSLSSTDVVDWSDSTFAVVGGPKVTLTAPNGGESWQRGTARTITWNANFSDSVRLWLIRNGQWVQEIATPPGSSGSYEWTVPADLVSGGEYQIGIARDSDATVEDFSDGTFTITEPSGQVHVDVRAWDGTSITNPALTPSSCSVRLYNDQSVYGSDVTPDGSWRATFSGLVDGTYQAEGRCTSPTFGEVELWGVSGIATVSNGSTETVQLLRTEPFISGTFTVQTAQGSVVAHGGSVLQGTALELMVDVFNGSGSGRLGYVQVWASDGSGTVQLVGTTGSTPFPAVTDPADAIAVTVSIGPLASFSAGEVWLAPRVWTYNAQGVASRPQSWTDVWSWGASADLILSEPTGDSPTADFSWSPSEPLQGETVQFTNLSQNASTFDWDLDGDGQYDTSASNPTHAYSVPGGVRVELCADSAYGERHCHRHEVPVQSTENGPVITSVIREYPGVFLEGTPADITNTLDVRVDWDGSPGEVSFSVNGSAAVIENGTSLGAQHALPVAASFAPSLSPSEVAITPTNGEGVTGPTRIEHVYLFPYPGWLEDALDSQWGDLSFNDDTPGELRLELSSEFPTPHWSEGCDLTCALDNSCPDCMRVPDWVPYIGGAFDLTETYATIDGHVATTGNGELSVYGQSGFIAMGKGGVEASIAGYGTFRLWYPDGLDVTQADFAFNLAGVIQKQVGIIEAIPQLSAAATTVPILKSINEHATLTGSIAPALELTAAFAQDPITGQLVFDQGSGQMDLDMKIVLDIDLVSDRIAASGWVAGGGSLLLGVPEKPLVRWWQLRFQAGLGLTVDYFFGSKDWEWVLDAACDWRPETGTVCALGEEERSYELFRETQVELVEVDYGRFGAPSRFVTTQRARTASARVPVSVREADLVTNVFPGASPWLVETSNGNLLLWEHQDTADPILQSTEIRWSMDTGGWTTPADVVDDTRAELSPVAAVDAAGQVVAAWLRSASTRFAQPIATRSDMATFYSQIEVVTATFDPASQTWSSVTELTSNSLLDTELAIASDGGDVLLAWLTCSDSDPLALVESSCDVMTSWWDGSSWSTPSTLATSLAGITALDATVHGSAATVIVARDPDIATANDTQLEMYTFNGSSWSGPAVFASGNEGSRLPSLVTDASDVVHVLWLQGDDLVHAILDSPTPEVIREGSASVAFYDAQMLVSPAGNLTVLWQEVVDNGPANLFVRLFDPASETWSADRRLTEDPVAKAHSVTGVYGSDGHLRASYLATEIERTSQMVTIDGEELLVDNMPSDGRTDLRYLDHSLVVDLATGDSKISAVPPRPDEGDPIEVTVVVHNAGDFPVSSCLVDLYSGDPDSGGTLLASDTLTGPFAAGDSRQITFMTTYPGTGDLVVVADASDQVTELSEANNRAVHWLDNRAPEAHVVASQTAGQPPLTVSFDATGTADADGDSFTCSWSFADGTPAATGTTVEHTFGGIGSYPVTLSVRDERGATSSAVVLVTVGSEPGELNGDGAVTTSDLGYIVAWLYNVSRAVYPDVDGDGDVNAGDLIAEIGVLTGSPFGGEAPSGGFTWTPSSATAGGSVQLLDGSQGGPTHWYWELGDGVTSTARDPLHTFTTAGTYTVRQTVSNPWGADTVLESITVLPAPQPPVAGFTVTPDSPQVGDTVQFNDTSTGNPTSWSWDFADGSTSTAQNPTHTFGAAGTYTVGLTVSNVYGSDSTSQQMTVSSDGVLVLDELAVIPTSNSAMDVAVGDDLWVAVHDDGIAGFDVADLANVSPLGTRDTRHANGLALQEDYAYVADQAAGIKVISLQDPMNPSLVGSLSTPRYCQDVTLDGSIAYYAVARAALWAVDISDPANPTKLDAVGPTNVSGHGSYGLAVQGELGYNAYSAGLMLVDLSNPSDMLELSTVATPGSAFAVDARDTIAAVADQTGGVHLIDVSDASSPTIVSTIPAQDSCLDAQLVGDLLFVADNEAGLFVYDIEDPAQPMLVAQHDTAGQARRVLMDGNRAYVADGANGVVVLDISPLVGQVPTEGLVAHFPMDGDATDHSGNGNDGSVHGAVSFAAGRVSQAADLDGQTGHIQTASDSSLQVADLTLAAWIYCRGGTDTSQFIVVQGTSFDTTGNFQLHINPSGELVLTVNNLPHWSPATATESVPSNPVPFSEWHHVAITFTDNTVTYYIDGVESGSGAYDISHFRTTNDGLIIGDREYGGRHFDGLIDELYVFSRALSSSQIQQLYEFGMR